MSKPRIIILMHYLELGGAEMALIGLLYALDPEQVDVDLFVYSHRGPMIVGLPVISMECSGPSELLDYGKYGILCNDYDNLRDSIITVSKDYNLLNSLRNQATMRGRTFNTENSVNRIIEIIE